jgi:predicted kinase
MDAILLIGIQATGKSTFYKQNFADTHLRINLDMLRTRHREAIILQACLDAKQSFVVDNTNPTQANREKYISLAKPLGFKIIGYYFQSKVREAIMRNRLREGKACIPEKGILATRGRLEIPNYSEGFDQLYAVTMLENHGFMVKPWATGR